MEEKKLFLLDAYALIYRAYYALFRSPRLTSSGLNTSAIFGFCNTLDEILRKEKPDYIAVCFDPPGGHTFRHEAYPEYKAQRDKQPEDITVSVPYIKRILEAYRIPVVEMANYEADDVIGSLAKAAGREGFTTYMMTPDKDYGQLVDDHTFMYRPALKGKGFEIRGPQEVCERYGISTPLQVIDLLALEGDASDNVPGCPGVGEKTAAKLIAEWGSVENLLDNVDSLKGALRTKVADNAEQIRFSKFLVTIKTDVPLDVTPEMLIRREPDVDALVAIYDELEFKTFAARLKPSLPEPAKVSAEMGSLFDSVDDDAAAEASPSMEVEMLDDAADVARFVGAVLEADMVGVSFFVVGDDAMTARLEGVAMNIADDRSAYVALPPEGMGREELMAELAPLFASEKLTVATADVKRDLLLLRRENVAFTARFFDVSIAHYILSPETNHRPANLAA